MDRGVFRSQNEPRSLTPGPLGEPGSLTPGPLNEPESLTPGSLNPIPSGSRTPAAFQSAESPGPLLPPGIRPHRRSLPGCWYRPQRRDDGIFQKPHKGMNHPHHLSFLLCLKEAYHVLLPSALWRKRQDLRDPGVYFLKELFVFRIHDIIPGQLYAHTEDTLGVHGIFRQLCSLDSYIFEFHGHFKTPFRTAAVLFSLLISAFPIISRPAVPDISLRHFSYVNYYYIMRDCRMLLLMFPSAVSYRETSPSVPRYCFRYE